LATSPSQSTIDTQVRLPRKHALFNHIDKPTRHQTNTPPAAAPTQIHHHAAQKSQNIYKPPSSPHLAPIIICCIVMAVCALPSLETCTRTPAGSKPHSSIYGAHIIKTAIFMTRLSKHGVTVGSVAWRYWVGTCFVGGKFCYEHFDRVVAEGGVK
jgi:hypothetical protein